MLKASKCEAHSKIRFPYRDVKDDDVDRPQVYRQQCHSRAVLIARNFRKRERSRVDKGGRDCERLFFFVKDRDIQAVTARGIHLYPFRTEKLSPATPMVLRKWESR